MRLRKLFMMNNMYPLNQSALYACGSKKKLGELIYLNRRSISRIKSIIGYYEFEIPKHSSGSEIPVMRKITDPNRQLKRIQRRIHALLKYVETPDYLHSGVFGRSYITNAKYHQSSNYMVTLDIAAFYNNCKRSYVYKFWHKTCKCAPDIAEILTELTTYQSIIPTGCPTSQRVAFFSYKEMFDELNSIAENYHCKFSVFVDDLTFSSNDPFVMSKIVSEVKRVLVSYRHKAKESKIKYYGKNDTKIVTGVAIYSNHQLRPLNKQQWKLFKLIQKGINHVSESELRSMIGQINAMRNVFSEGYKFLNTRRIVRKRLQVINKSK